MESTGTAEKFKIKGAGLNSPWTIYNVDSTFQSRKTFPFTRRKTNRSKCSSVNRFPLSVNTNPEMLNKRSQAAEAASAVFVFLQKKLCYNFSFKRWLRCENCDTCRLLWLKGNGQAALDSRFLPSSTDQPLHLRMFVGSAAGNKHQESGSFFWQVLMTSCHCCSLDPKNWKNKMNINESNSPIKLKLPKVGSSVRVLTSYAGLPFAG